MKNILKTLFVSSVIVITTSCSTPKVSYVDSNSVNNLTTNFTMTDLLLVTQNMSQNLITSGKLNRCKTYTVSPVINKTDQYIDTSTITQSIQDKLSNSNMVSASYVIASDEMQNQVDELQRQNQSGLYNKSTNAKIGKMEGAECRIDGFVSNIVSVSPDGKTQRIDYQYNMKLINIQKGMGLWSSQKIISKQQSN